jgi:ligand-binding sensor domain-containing protein
VRCILQDHLGYMWFGTQNGLVRYDGYDMKIYQPDSNDSLSISNRQIRAIYEDRSGNLWIGTGMGELGGLNRLVCSLSMKIKLGIYLLALILD